MNMKIGLIFALLYLTLFIGVAQADEVFVYPEVTELDEGMTFVVEIQATANQSDMFSIQYDVVYDNSLLTLNSVEEGDLLNNNSQDFTLFGYTELAGRLDTIYNSRNDTNGIYRENGTLITLNFTADGDGLAYINVTELIWVNSTITNSSAAIFEPIITNGTVNITTPVDTTPPGPVTGLTTEGVGSNFIDWVWTNPVDADLDHVEVWINGSYQSNTTNEYYNATGLNLSTEYTISIITVDTTGNLGSFVNDTQNTTDIDTSPPILTYVDPTPHDTAEQTESTITINVSANEQLSSCILTLDGANSSMTLNGHYCYQTATLTKDAHTYYVFANDTSGNNATTSQRTITIVEAPVTGGDTGTGGSTGGSSPGGDEPEETPVETPEEKAPVEIDPSSFTIKIAPGEGKKYSFDIVNNGDMFDAVMSVEGAVFELITLEESTVRVDPGARKTVNFDVLALPSTIESEYLGTIKITIGEEEYIVSLIVTVEKTREPLLDVFVDTLIKVLFSGEALPIEMTFINMGETETIDASVDYVIKNLETQEVVNQIQEDVVIGEKLSFSRDLTLPEMKSDRYVVEVTVSYYDAGKFAYATDSFDIIPRPAQNWYLLVVAGIIVAIVIVFFVLYKRSQQHTIFDK